MNERSSVIKARGRRLWMRLAILLLVVYCGYAAFHILTGLSNECGRDSIASTLFPVRQLYLIPAVKKVWYRRVSSAIGEGESGWSALAQMLDDSMKELAIEIVSNGDCQTVENLSESLGRLGLFPGSPGSN